MRNRCRELLLLFFMAAAGLSGQAYAGEFTLYAGWANPGKLTLANVRTGLGGSTIYGVRLGGTFGRVIGLEQTIAFSPDFLRPEDFAATGKVRGFISNTNLVVNAPVGRLVPYATAGIGWIKPFDSNSQLLFGTKFAVNYGGGLKFTRLAGPLGLRFDARGYTATGVFSRNLKIFEVSGGLLFSF